MSGNNRRDQQNKVGAQAIKEKLIEIDDDGKIFFDDNGRKKELNVDANRKSAAILENFMDQKVPMRRGQTDTAAAQRTLGLSRKRRQPQRYNPQAKRHRSSETPSQAGTPAPATSGPATPAAPAAALSSPAMRYPAIDDQILAVPDGQDAAVSAPEAQPPVTPAAAVEPGSQPNRRQAMSLAVRPRTEPVPENPDLMANLGTPEESVSEVEEVPRVPQSENYFPQVAPDQPYLAHNYSHNAFPGNFNLYGPNGFQFNPPFVPHEDDHLLLNVPYLGGAGAAPMDTVQAPPQFAPYPNGPDVNMNRFTQRASVPNHPNAQWPNPQRSYGNNPVQRNGGGHATRSGSSAAQAPPKNDSSLGQSLANNWASFHEMARQMRDHP